VKLTIRQWDGFRKDKRVSEKVDHDFQTAGEAGNYNKRLLDKTALSPIQKISSKIRKEHNRMTMPWCYDGVSLLPSKLVFDYGELMRELKDLHATAVNNLVVQYPIYKANQARRLGALYDPDDYPDQSTVAASFGIEHSYFPVPQSEHFIVDLESAEMSKMKDALTHELQQTQANALASLYERVEDIVTHLHERLSDPENIFRDSLLSNVEQLVGVLPNLNVFNDPTLTKVCQEMQSRILIADAQMLRDVPEVRQTVANNAFDIVALLKGEHLKAQAA
jgi:hypothetical protein